MALGTWRLGAIVLPPPLLPTPAPCKSLWKHSEQPSDSGCPPSGRGQRNVGQKLGSSALKEQLSHSLQVRCLCPASRLIVQCAESHRGCSLEVHILFPSACLSVFSFSLPSALSPLLGRILAAPNSPCVLERRIEKEKPLSSSTRPHLMPPKEFRGDHLLETH